mmetsp:Transcript_118156/g.294703  ORF Transcript_118156/g.294703 Transcript_118156/m.294703 type:complete len:206 (+) Transcript_118156:2-619(+)
MHLPPALVARGPACIAATCSIFLFLLLLLLRLPFCSLRRALFRFTSLALNLLRTFYAFLALLALGGLLLLHGGDLALFVSLDGDAFCSQLSMFHRSGDLLCHFLRQTALPDVYAQQRLALHQAICKNAKLVAHRRTCCSIPSLCLVQRICTQIQLCQSSILRDHGVHVWQATHRQVIARQIQRPEVLVDAQILEKMGHTIVFAAV